MEKNRAGTGALFLDTGISNAGVYHGSVHEKTGAGGMEQEETGRVYSIENGRGMLQKSSAVPFRVIFSEK